MNRIITILATLLVAMTMQVSAATIDFESDSFSEVSSVDYGDVIFSTTGTATLSTAGSPLGGTAVRSNPFSTGDAFLAQFTSVASMVSVDLGDFGPSDLDPIFLKAYSAADVLLGSIMSDCCDAANEMATLTLSSIGAIDYVVFGSTGQQFPNSVFFDNFTYELGDDLSPVPLPAAAWLFLSGLAGLAGFRMKKKSA